MKETNNQHDEKDLDNLFDSNNLSKAIKKAKWRTLIRNIIISAIATIVVLIGGSIISRELTYKLEAPIQIAVDNFNMISAPDKFIGKVTRYHGNLTGKNVISTYKMIYGKVVYTGDDEYTYGFFNDNAIGTESPLILGQSWTEEDLSLTRYNSLGQREMVFFYPFINYKNYKNDLNLLGSIDSKKNIELALSFDKAYSLDEVTKMMPANIKPTWYWIDDLNNEEKETAKSHKDEQTDENGNVKQVDTPARLRSEYTAYGIKAINANGELEKEPATIFMLSLKNGAEISNNIKGTDYRSTIYKYEFKRLFNNISGTDRKLTKDDLHVFGVVVTGNAQTLMTLKELPFIKATSLGVITDQF